MFSNKLALNETSDNAMKNASRLCTSTQFFKFPQRRIKSMAADRPALQAMTKDCVKLEITFSIIYAVTHPNKRESPFCDDEAVRSHIETQLIAAVDEVQNMIQHDFAMELTSSKMVAYQNTIKSSLIANLEANGICLYDMTCDFSFPNELEKTAVFKC